MNGLSFPGHGWLGMELQWWVLITLGIGSFMGSLNTGIVNIMLPVIRQSFGADLSSIEWVLMAYLLTLCILLLSFGRLGDILGYKRVYIAGLLTFIIGSGLCGISPNETFLIAARVGQAIGAAMVISNASAILTSQFPAEQRGQLLGIQLTAGYLGLLVGPALGGYLTDLLGWRSVFFLNLPIGLVAAAMSFWIIPSHRPAGARESFDLVGAGAMTIGMGALLLGISKGQALGWTSPLILGMIALSAISLVFFLRFERSLSYAMLDLGLFRSRLFKAATASAFLNYLCVFSASFLLPFYLMQGRSFTPSFAGLLITAQPLAMAMVAPISGYLSDRMGSRLLSTSGSVIILITLFALRNLGPESNVLEIVVPLFCLGIGSGLFVSPNTSAIMGSAPPNRQGVASGIVATARSLGMVFGVAIGGAVLSLQIALRAAGQAESQLAFFGAFQDTFLVLSIIAIIAASTSLVRGAGDEETRPRFVH